MKEWEVLVNLSVMGSFSNAWLVHNTVQVHALVHYMYVYMLLVFTQTGILFITYNNSC